MYGSSNTPPGPFPPSGGGLPIRNGILLFVGFLLVVFGTSFLALYVDWLWFVQVGFDGVFRTILTTKLALGTVAALVCFGLVYPNLKVVAAHPKDRLYVMLEGEQSLQLKLVLDQYLGPVVIALAAVIALMSGFKASTEWEHVLRFMNATEFGRVDPQLGKDLGFYVFELPFVHYIQGWLLGTLMLVLVLSVGAYMAMGGIVLAPTGPQLSPVVCRHLGLLVGGLFLVLAWGYHLEIYDTLFTKTGVVTGATYTDIYARIPAYRLLTVVAVVAAAAIAYGGFKGEWKVPAVTAGIVMLVSFLGVSVLPGLLQKYRVVPNEILVEGTYIQRNIEATRIGFGLDQISAEPFPANESLTGELLAKNKATIENVRLWDHKPLLSTYRQLQQIRTYYDFVDVDNDRYIVDGDIRQIMLSPRELSYANLPGGTNWINEHLTYTHGYGVAVGPVNRISPEGLPEFLVQDIPPASSTPSLQVTRPEIYYGELANDYVFVGTMAKEFDYPEGDKNRYATYRGEGGVSMDGVLRKLAIAAYFQTTKILFSSDISSDSRVMYHRNIQDRVSMVAPYLSWDADPYMIVTEEGRLVWMLDGYTTTDHLPYGEPLGRMGNYIRNSVKAVVDAYDGSINLYIVDPNDPLLATYAKAFEGVFEPLSAMSDDLRSHMRYPQDLFSIQAHMLQQYHMLEPQIFYNSEDLWAIPRQGDKTMKPYYTIMRLPGEAQEEFILLLPYTPARRDNMTAWLAARSDGEHYGKLVVYLFPKQKLIYGPRQIEARIDQDADISEQLTLWSQMGSSVIRGTLLVIPIEDSLLYIEPLYLAAERGSLPELRRVIVSYGNKMVMEANLELALARIFGDGGGGLEDVSRVQTLSGQSVGLHDASPQELAKKAQLVFESARKAARDGDWSGYGERINELESLLNHMAQPE